jgi:putative two-component system response regulator
MALHRRGHAVRTCAYKQEAQEHVERVFFDAVLCGQRLPDGTGQELCSWIKGHEDLQGLPVAMLVEADTNQQRDPLVEIALAGGQPGGPALSGPTAPDDYILLPVRPEELVLRVSTLLKLRRYREEINNSLVTLLTVAEGVEEQDRRSRGHCKRLSLMAVLLGSILGVDEYQLLTLERAGYLHDIGKASIPGAILDKSQPLTAREMEIIKAHCVLGERLCSPIGALQSVLPIIRHHHERGDGSGYPDGLTKERIPRLAQMFSIVDVYDSLRTWRPYRPPLGEWQAVEVMRHEVARGFWNREFFEAFAKHIVPGLAEHLESNHVLWPQD